MADTKTTINPEPIAVHNSNTITVVVVNAKSQPVSGATVSITPSNESATTNSQGEVQFKLGDATKYNITATADGKTVTVPYYVTKDGATRLVVNPVYVKSIEKKLHPNAWLNSNLFISVGIGLGVIILFVIARKFIRRKRKIKSSTK